MSTDVPFKPPRKKKSILWWLGGIFLLILILLVFQLFGPNPPIVVSAQTTHITAPLQPDGLPDYAKYILERSRKGVTPQNNAAALLWPALWPGELDPPEYAAIASELGLDSVPLSKDAVTKLYNGPTQKQIAEWLEKQQPHADSAKSAPPGSTENAGSDSTRNGAADDAAETVIDRAMSSPWTSQQVPLLAKWVAENQKPLDKMVEASARPRCYFPSPSLLDPKPPMLLATLLPGIQALRNAGRMLSVRAMWSAGENRNGDAWRDLLATHRIGHLVSQDSMTLVEQFVGLALDGMAHEGTLSLLDLRSLTSEQAQQIQRDLESLPNFHGVAGALDNIERLVFLDTVIGYRNDRENEMGDIAGMSYIKYVRVDWNVALRKGNEYFDRIVAAARLPQCKARKQAFAQVESDMNRLASEAQQTGNAIAGIIDPARRSDTVASAMIALLLPAFNAGMDAEDRSNMGLELERLAAALAVYRIEHGKYPEKLEGLVPGVLSKLPIDLYNAKPLIYKRTDDGYLLYSAGDNGVDDGGSNEAERVLEGRSIDDRDDLDEAAKEKLQIKIPAGADDRAIRTPRPAFAIPKIKPQPATDSGP